MPNRIIRDSARTSPTLAELTGDEERFYWRLITVADDYGRFEGDPCVMRALCFPRQVDTISTADVAAWFVKLAAVGLVQPYVIDGRQFGVFVTWERHQRIRAKESRFPPPNDGASPAPDAIGGHPLSSDSMRQHVKTNVAVVEVVDVNEVVNEVGAAAPLAAVAKKPPNPSVNATAGLEPELLARARKSYPSLRDVDAVVCEVWAEKNTGKPKRIDLQSLDDLIRKAVPLSQIVAHLRCYLDTVAPQFQSLPTFCSKFAQYAPKPKVVKAEHRPFNPEDFRVMERSGA